MQPRGCTSMSDWPVTPMERQVELPANPSEVWEALTRGDQVSEWFGAEVEMDAGRGGKAIFRWPDGRVRTAVIEIFEPEDMLVLRWLPFERDASGATHACPATTIRFVLKAAQGGTLLEVHESVPGEPPGPLAGRGALSADRGDASSDAWAVR
jgi:uncharacterized protein YndB with AHSA1/START domain